MPMPRLLRNDLDEVLRQLKLAIDDVNLAEAKATKTWTDTQAAYERVAVQQNLSAERPLLFQDWILRVVGHDQPGFRRLTDLAYQEPYKHLPSEKRILVDNLTKKFELEGYWNIFFAFGPSIVDSRKSLEIAKRIKRKRPAITLAGLLDALREARTHRAGNNKRGSANDVSRFVLEDFKRAEAVLLRPKEEEIPGGAAEDIPGGAKPEANSKVSRSSPRESEHRVRANAPSPQQGQSGSQDLHISHNENSKHPPDNNPSTFEDNHENNPSTNTQAQLSSAELFEEDQGEHFTPEDDHDDYPSIPEEAQSDAIEVSREEIRDADPPSTPKQRSAVLQALNEANQRGQSPPTPEQGRTAVEVLFEASSLLGNDHDSTLSTPERADSLPFTPDGTPGLNLSRTFRQSQSPEIRFESRFNFLSASQKGDLVRPKLLPLEHDDSFVFEYPYHHSSDGSVSDESEVMEEVDASRRQSEVREVNTSWRRSWGINDTITFHRQPLSSKDVATLDDNVQLNDEVINTILKWLADKNKSDIEVFLHNTFFFNNFKKRGYDGVWRWTRKVDVPKLQYMIIPIHEPNHWVLAILVLPTMDSIADPQNARTATVITIDSLDNTGSEENKAIFHHLKSYVASLVDNIDPDNIAWKHARGFARQESGNTYDCGVYILLAVEEFFKSPASFIQKACDTTEEPKDGLFDPLQGRHHYQNVLIQIKKECQSSKVDDTDASSVDQTASLFAMRLDMASAMEAFQVLRPEPDIEDEEYVVDSRQWKFLLSAEAGADISPLTKLEDRGSSDNVPAPKSLLEEKQMRDKQWDDFSARLTLNHQILEERLQSARAISTALSGLVQVLEQQLGRWKAEFERNTTALSSDHNALTNTVSEKTRMLDQHSWVLRCHRNAERLAGSLGGEIGRMEGEIRRVRELDEEELQRVTVRKRRRVG